MPLALISFPFTTSRISCPLNGDLRFMTRTMTTPRNIANRPSDPVSILPSKTADLMSIEPVATKPRMHIYTPEQIKTKEHNIDAAAKLNRSIKRCARLGLITNEILFADNSKKSGASITRACWRCYFSDTPRPGFRLPVSSRENSCTMRARFFTFSTGVSGKMPWPRLKMWPGRPPAR
jgi:hypothetical protein